MIEIEFDYQQQVTVIQAKADDLFQDVINKYLQKTLMNPNDVFFIANGMPLKPEEKVESLISPMNKEDKKIIILVQLIEREDVVQEFSKSKDIICPKCYECCQIKFSNFSICLFGCSKNHATFLKPKEFYNSQNINITNIICEKCKVKNKANSPNNEFYRCLTCNTNLCLLCKSIHQLDHNIINYEQKNYICNKHHEHFIKYCYDCHENICYNCDVEHKNHNKLLLNDITPNINELTNYLQEMKKEIDIFNKYIKELINQLNDLIEEVNAYYEINNSIIKDYEMKNRNYQILESIKQIDNNREICEKIININKISGFKDKLYKVFSLYGNEEIMREELNKNLRDVRKLMLAIAEEDLKGECREGKNEFAYGKTEEDEFIKEEKLSDLESHFQAEWQFAKNQTKILEKTLKGKIIVGWKLKSDHEDGLGGFWQRKKPIIGTSNYSILVSSLKTRGCNWKLRIWVIDDNI